MCESKYSSRRHFSVCFGSVELSRKISFHVKLWGWFWNIIETLHILSWISFKMSREYLVQLRWIKTRLQSLDSVVQHVHRRTGIPKVRVQIPLDVNTFQLTSAGSDYHEKFLFAYRETLISFSFCIKAQRHGWRKENLKNLWSFHKINRK